MVAFCCVYALCCCCFASFSGKAFTGTDTHVTTVVTRTHRKGHAVGKKVRNACRSHSRLHATLRYVVFFSSVAPFLSPASQLWASSYLFGLMPAHRAGVECLYCPPSTLRLQLRGRAHPFTLFRFKCNRLSAPSHRKSTSGWDTHTHDSTSGIIALGGQFNVDKSCTTSPIQILFKKVGKK